MKTRIYTGQVMHTRKEPVKHSFQYPLYVYAFDLDELEALDHEIRWFGYNRFAPVSIYDRDYLYEGLETIKQKLITFLMNHGCHDDISRIELVTSARYFNYVFNPVSFYYCYKQDNSTACIVAEVNNTFQERHVYLLDHPNEITNDQLQRYIKPKSFHVSPFNDMQGEYDFYFAHLNGKMDVRINILKEHKPVFFTRMWGESIPLTSSNLQKNILRYPITAWLNMPRILKEAAMLYYQKHLPVFTKPHPVSDMTIKVAKPKRLQHYAMNNLTSMMSKMKHGLLQMELPDRSIQQFGDTNATAIQRMKINHYRFFSHVLKSGDIGLGESYVDGDWDTENLTELISLLIQNKPSLQKAALGNGVFGRLFYQLNHWLNRNTQKGSRKNIHNHYDIGNIFYQHILDPSMMYSSAYFNSPDESLESAQKNKIQKLIIKLKVQPQDHVLEIGSGWGGMAIETAKQTGCRVTTITISDEQYKYAVQKIKDEGLENQIDIQLCDYRTIEGQFDKIVSIEMIEAVGHEYLGTFFANCDRLLKPNGIMALQAITIPDQRYDSYRKNSDWIQQYIFPGAVVPSLTALSNAATKHSNLFVDRIENIGVHYAKTLNIWRKNLYRNKENIIHLGMDERFIRTWDYYLSYCEAAFATRHLNTLQIVLSRQNNSSLTELS